MKIMLEFIFEVVEVKRYPNSQMVWVRTSIPSGTMNRFFVPDSDIWKIGNTIRRTIQKVAERVEMPNTIYVEQMGLYQIHHELINND
jgi:hypothetical protein